MSDGRYAMLETPKHFSVGHRSVPEPAEGEVRLRVHDCGVCGSDLKMWAGTHAFLRAPLLLGHEIYGTVEELGARTNGIQKGSAVVVFPAVGCGTCFHCERNQPQLCADMRFFGGQLPGGLAEHVIVPEDNLIVVPDTVPEQQRVLIEPLGVGVHAVARAQIEPGETAVVLGGGAIGLFTALVARARGLEIVLIGEPSAARRSRAEALGFETFDTDTTPVAEAVTAYTSGSAFAEFQDAVKGTIARGKLADMVILSADILSIPPAQIKDVRVLTTIVGGRIVHQRKP